MTYEQLGGDATGMRIGEWVFADYAEAGQLPNPGMMVWAWRCCYDISQGMPIDQAELKHRNEMRAILGLPPMESIAPPAGEWGPTPRDYSGNMCGTRVAGIEPVGGGSNQDPELVLSWFYDRYRPESRTKIRADWKAKGLVDVLMSWPDSRAYGFSPDQFLTMLHELRTDGFYPTVMLLSKDYDPHNDVQGCLNNVNQILPQLLDTKLAARICIGWELCLDRWIHPEELDQLTDDIAPRCVAAGVPCYVHFQQEYAHMDHDPGGSFGGYWKRQRGKLTGLLHQNKQTGTRDNPPWDKPMYEARLVDILDRFSGKINVGLTDNGIDGHPFECIALEIKAWDQFYGRMGESEGNSWGQVAINTPAVSGPNGTCRIMGSGNGR